tara:strand:- start:1260 stop:1487 length:228 start_codon:yes stop_codon:yes gene_type:complete
MENAFKLVKGFFAGVTDLLTVFIALAVVVQVVFGGPVFGMDVIGNIVDLINALGASGFVGVLAVVLLISFFDKKK